MVRKILIGAGIAVVVVLTSSLSSLGRERRHTQTTAALPLFYGHTDGRVRIPAEASNSAARVVASLQRLG